MATQEFPIGVVASQSPPCVQMYVDGVPPACVRRWPPPLAHETEQTEPMGQKPEPEPQDCTALWSPTDGMFFGQPWEDFETCGHRRDALLIVADMPPVWSLVLHFCLNCGRGQTWLFSASGSASVAWRSRSGRSSTTAPHIHL